MGMRGRLGRSLRRAAAGWGLLAVMAWGCASGGDGAQACKITRDCPAGSHCIDSRCVERPDAAWPVGNDGGRDGAQGAVDAGPDPVGGSRRDGGRPLEGGADASAADAEPDAPVPRCDDGMRNGDETGVDCGGPCPPCAECGACAADADCTRGRCVSGRCALRSEVYVDWAEHCSADGSATVEVEDLPAGRYEVTARESAGTVWDPPYSPPERGWSYRITCENLAASALRTPSGIRYATADEAFANLEQVTEQVDFGGGTLVCAFRDDPCTDNHGGVRFELERACP